MRTFFKILSILFISYTSVKAQGIINIDGGSVLNLDTSFSYKDTLQSIFFKRNVAEIWTLRQDINKLRFDHCNHSDIGILAYLDSTGKVAFAQIIHGTYLPKTDSLIIVLMKDAVRKFKTVIFNNISVRSMVYIKYKFHNRNWEEFLVQTNGNNDVAERMVNYGSFTLTMKTAEEARKLEKKNECTDGAYFYDEGVKSFQQGDLSKAIYNFSQAIEANPNDFDSLYNLGLSYQKADKLKKACKCFAEGKEATEASASQAFNKYCLQIANK
jgi:tetratricopeptide (TPR) repeat protein